MSRGTSPIEKLNSASRKKAELLGEIHYVPVSPCLKGHFLRYTKNRTCVLCNKEGVNNPGAKERHAVRARKRRYGVTPEAFNQLKGHQGGRCGICLSKFNSDSEAFVDHDHKTGDIRGLLCRRCNSALGYFKDSAQILRIAAHYVELGGIHIHTVDQEPPHV